MLQVRSDSGPRIPYTCIVSLWPCDFWKRAKQTVGDVAQGLWRISHSNLETAIAIVFSGYLAERYKLVFCCGPAVGQEGCSWQLSRLMVRLL